MKYNIAIISYIDILGFRNIVSENQDPKSTYEILEIFKKKTEPIDDLAKLYEQKYLFFSDTVIRSTNILSDTNKKYQVGILFHELLDLIYIQMDLIEKGIFIRGSVVINLLYHSNPFVFGPGLIHAYEMENKLAIYPRIIIDQTVFELLKDTPLLKAQHHSFEDEETYVGNLIRKDENDIVFLDYLSVAETEVNDYPADYIEFLQKHKSFISQNLKKYENDERTFNKYKWLRDYHNTIVRNKFSREGNGKTNITRSKLIIP